MSKSKNVKELCHVCQGCGGCCSLETQIFRAWKKDDGISFFVGPQAPKRIELKVGNLENLDLLNRWCLIFPMENRSSQGKIHPNFGNQSRPMDMLSPEASLPDKNASQPDKRLPSLDGFPALQVASQPYKWLPSQINGFPA